jgi:hypothetical protein
MLGVIREAIEQDEGIYIMPFEWTMGGDWIVTVSGELSDGRSLEEKIELSVSSVSDGQGRGSIS